MINKKESLSIMHNSTDAEKLELLIEQNLALSEEIYRLTKKVHNYMRFSRIVSWIQLFIILAPIIFAMIYLPPFIKKVFNTYEGVLSAPTSNLK